MVSKSREIWDKSAGKKVNIMFERLNVIDNYNYKMNSVDIADQLRDIYRFDGPWMRQRKWWWALWLWAIGVAVVNAYLCYKAQCTEKGIEPMSHRTFQERLARDLCHTGIN
eukprot:gene30438-38045_t